MKPEQRKCKTAIVGASGYSGEELVRLLLNHPYAELTTITSRQYAGQPLSRIFSKFGNHPKARGLTFSEPVPDLIAREAEVAVLALPHGVASEVAVPLLERGCRIIDLSADFRLRAASTYADFYGHEHPAPALLAKAVYGLPEVYRDDIRKAQLVASPGCYPTSILLPLIPLLKAKLIEPNSIIADSLSGVSGAGRKAELDYLFVDCNESVRPYGIPKHRHLSEIEQELSLAAGENIVIQFTPHLVPINRGILTTLYVKPVQNGLGEKSANPAAQVAECLSQSYGNEPFIRLLTDKALPDTKNVVGSNMIEIACRFDPRTGRLLIMSAIDNLVKGASGQAIQSLNLMYGYEETAGLL